MAIFTLRDLLANPRPTIDLGDIVLSDFRRDSANSISPSQIVIETIEGDDPGLIIRTATPLTSSEAAQHFGFEFRVTADTSIIEGASVTMSGGTSFNPNGAGGSIDLDVGQASGVQGQRQRLAADPTTDDGDPHGGRLRGRPSHPSAPRRAARRAG